MNLIDLIYLLVITAGLAVIFNIADFLTIKINKTMSQFKGKKAATKEQEKQAKIIQMNRGKRPTAENFNFRIIKPYDKEKNSINIMPLLFNRVFDPRINCIITIFTLMNFNFTWIKHNGKK